MMTKQARREYYQKNRAEILASRREYYQNNREKVLAYARARYPANREKNNAACRRYRSRNRDVVRAKSNAVQKERTDILAIYKKLQGCTHCGYSECPAALHLHHRDPATKKFSVGNAGARAWPTIWAEVRKCDVLCANCHAKIHAEERARV